MPDQIPSTVPGTVELKAEPARSHGARSTEWWGSLGVLGTLGWTVTQGSPTWPQVTVLGFMAALASVYAICRTWRKAEGR